MSPELIRRGSSEFKADRLPGTRRGPLEDCAVGYHEQHIHYRSDAFPLDIRAGGVTDGFPVRPIGVAKMY